MTKVIKSTFVLIGIIIILTSLFGMLRANMNLGIIIQFLFGLLLICFGTIWTSLPKNIFIKSLKTIIYIGIAIFIIVIGIIYLTSKLNTANFKENAVIVLGCAVHGNIPSRPLVMRLNKAIEYNQKNPTALIVVTGGKGAQETVSEASAMYNYLISNGINSNNIIVEDKATSTYENFKYSKELLDKHLGQNYTVAYITNDYHSFRASQIAKEKGIQGFGYCTKTDIRTLVPGYLREVPAVIKFWIFRT